METVIRWIVRSDMPTVIQIDYECFGIHCWSEDDFIRVLRKWDCIGMVATQNDMIVGYMLYELHPWRLFVSRIAVSTAARRMRVGSRLIEKLLSQLNAARRSELIVRVPEGNVAAQLFFRSNGLLCYEIDDDDYLFRGTADSVASKGT